MAYNEKIVERIEKYFNSKKIKFEGKKMMGGLCYMVNDKMCIGVEKERIMARVGPENYDAAMKRKDAKPMDFTGKVMKGFIFIDAKNVSKDSDLKYWLELCLEYNPKAKVTSKKKKSMAEKKQKDTSSENILDELKKIILKCDKKVEAKDGKIMGATGTVFNQEDVFKYAIAKTKTGYTFHSLVMYSNPDMYNDLNSKMTKAKFQKGCANFKSEEEFPVKLFEEHMKKSAKCDYSKVIDHYKKKKKMTR